MSEAAQDDSEERYFLKLAEREKRDVEGGDKVVERDPLASSSFLKV